VNPEQLATLEIAAGTVLGAGRAAEQPASVLPEPPSGGPGAAIEQAILPALERSPCLVSFSGGRDSAAVLAAATALARRHGLPDPIPATNVFPDAPETDESEWQEQVIGHLGLGDWYRIEHRDELDVIGPYAQRVLDAHGLRWPPNLHFHLPLLDAGRGGSLLTGIGGDELFGGAERTPLAGIRAGAVRPRPRHALALGLALAPVAIRRAVFGRRAPADAEWLRPRARRLVTKLLAAEAAAQPRRLGPRMQWWHRLPYLRAGIASFELIAADTGVRVAHPLLAPGLWSAVAAAAAPTGFADRTEGMRRLFGDLLPATVIERRSKTSLAGAFWTERARQFADGWDGSGVPVEWVDPRALACHWRRREPSAQSAMLLQSAWLTSRELGAPARDGGEQALERAVD
jgi:hypothetical protein